MAMAAGADLWHMSCIGRPGLLLPESTEFPAILEIRRWNRKPEQFSRRRDRCRADARRFADENTGLRTGRV